MIDALSRQTQTETENTPNQHTGAETFDSSALATAASRILDVAMDPTTPVRTEAKTTKRGMSPKEWIRRNTKAVEADKPSPELPWVSQGEGMYKLWGITTEIPPQSGVIARFANESETRTGDYVQVGLDIAGIDSLDMGEYLITSPSDKAGEFEFKMGIFEGKFGKHMTFSGDPFPKNGKKNHKPTKTSSDLVLSPGKSGESNLTKYLVNVVVAFNNNGELPKFGDFYSQLGFGEPVRTGRRVLPTPNTLEQIIALKQLPIRLVRSTRTTGTSSSISLTDFNKCYEDGYHAVGASNLVYYAHDLVDHLSGALLGYEALMPLEDMDEAAKVAQEIAESKPTMLKIMQPLIAKAGQLEAKNVHIYVDEATDVVTSILNIIGIPDKSRHNPSFNEKQDSLFRKMRILNMRMSILSEVAGEKFDIIAFREVFIEMLAERQKHLKIDDALYKEDLDFLIKAKAGFPTYYPKK